MVAYSGLRPLQGINLEALVANYAASDASPRIQLAAGIITPPIAFEGASVVGDTLLSAQVATSTRRTDVDLLVNHVAITQRHNIRGEGNTGRDENIGKAPQDGSGVGFDYFEKVNLVPGVVNLGNVVSDTIFNAVIQNTFRRDNQTVNSIVDNSGSGISLSGAAPPTTLAPLADRTYVITVTSDGPPNINGTIDWLTTFGTLQLLITGTRIIVFPYPPQADIEETLSWMTDVIKSVDGTEQRHSLRTNPRQSVAYEVVAEDLPKINKIRNLMISWTTKIFGVPMWWYERTLRADIVVSDLTIFVRAGGLDFADFREGGLAMIFQENADGTSTLDALQIQTINTSIASPESMQDSITFVTAVQNNYSADTATVMPIVPAILATPASQRTPQAALSSRYNLKFEAIENENTVPLIDIADYPSLNDFDGNDTVVLDDLNFISSTLNENFEQEAQRIDFDIGKFQQLTQELRARRSTPQRWVAESVQSEWRVRSVFQYLRGKLRNAWIPTWRHDFQVNVNIGVGVGTLDVENWDFSSFVDGGIPWAGLRILKTDGSVSYHRITATAEISTTVERVTIDPVTSFAATIAEVEKIDLLILARQAKDDLTITHEWTDAGSDELSTVIDTTFVGDVQ